MKRKNENAENGYNLRSKRAKLAPICSSSRRASRKKSPFSNLPTELQQKILTYISYEELGNTVRLVNRKFKSIVEYLMNVAFYGLEKKLESLKIVILVSMEHSQDDMETRCMCKLLNTVEYLILQYSILQANIWRHINNKYQSHNLCMYGGTILDLFYHILLLYTKEPYKIYTPNILYDQFPKEVKRLAHIVKTFIIYFDRVSELPLNNSVFYSGSKILDILNCASEAKREVKELAVNGDTLIYKVTYYLRNSWLVALETNDDKPKQWNEQMRLMYLRLRRIVMNHTEMTMEYVQYRRELDLRPNPRMRLKRPINSVYTGYGEVGDTFYYYGAMNEGAYLNKFSRQDNIFPEDDEELTNGEEPIPFVGLYITIDLTCPLHLGPLEILRTLEKDSPVLTTNGNPCNVFDLKMEFYFPGAKYPRLPTNHTVHITDHR